MRTLWTPRWLLVHAAVVIAVIAFCALCYWQVTRAAGGNALSFGYAIEWPAFAAFTGWVWIKEMRRALAEARAADADPAGVPADADFAGVPADADRAGVPAGVVAELAPAGGPSRDTSARRPRAGAAYDDSDDEELAAYNRYLGWLNAHPKTPKSEYPG